MVRVAKKETAWWHDFYTAFRPFFGLVPQKETNAQVRYITKKLSLKPGKKFLDCPCGIGRISLPVAKMGIRVTGVDIIPSYLDEISTRAKQRGLKIALLHSDMRRINFDSKFDAAGNLWTSFGFFDKESDNRFVVKKMYQALKPGGKFMLHLINRDWIIANFRPRDWYEAGGVKSMEERYIDYRTSVNHGLWHFIKNGEEKAINSPIRLYSLHELIAIFRSTGFINIESYGSVKDEPVTRDSRMMYVIGTKPRRK